MSGGVVSRHPLGAGAGTAPARSGWPAALLSAALITVAVRPWWLGTELLGVGWLALVAYLPVLTAWRSEPSALRAGGYLGLVALGPALVAYEVLGPFAPAAVPLLALGASLPFAALGALGPRLRRALGDGGLLAAFPLLWLAAEAVPGRTWLLGRFAAPLLAVGLSQAGLPTMQLARYGGLAGVGLAVLACNALLAVLVAPRAARGRRATALALAGLLGLIAATAAAAARSQATTSAPTSNRTSAGRIGVRVVQLALPDAAYAAAAALPAARQALVAAFVRAGAAAGPPAAANALTVWPEGALPGPLPSSGATGLEPLLAGHGPLLAGAPARTERGVANAVFAWQGGELRRVYAKRRLAPFTEDRLVAGEPAPPVALGGVRVASLLCFEALFPGLARAAAKDGAQLLAVLTNDAFALHLDVPENHLRIARFRAVETGLPLAFASNAGPSAVVDGAGRVLARAPQGRAGVAAAALELRTAPPPYLRWGDWPSTLALAGSGLLALLAGALGGAPRA